jgi:hypothetical protein
MGAPRTLRELRAAVARVLVARGEAADALYVDHDQWGVSVGVTVCGCGVEWVYETSMVRAEAVGLAWAAIVRELQHVVDAAGQSVAATRRPERKAAAMERLRRARAAVEAAQAVEAGE